MESKDLPLRGPSFLLEYMFKCRSLCLSVGGLSLPKVGCLPEERRALLFNSRESREGAII